MENIQNQNFRLEMSKNYFHSRKGKARLTNTDRFERDSVSVRFLSFTWILRTAYCHPLGLTPFHTFPGWLPTSVLFMSSIRLVSNGASSFTVGNILYFAMRFFNYAKRVKVAESFSDTLHTVQNFVPAKFWHHCDSDSDPIELQSSKEQGGHNSFPENWRQQAIFQAWNWISFSATAFRNTLRTKVIQGPKTKSPAQNKQIEKRQVT